MENRFASFHIWTPPRFASASLHGDQTRLKLAEEVEHLRALELFAADRLLMAVDAVNLEHLLCQIDADSLKFHGDSLLQ